MNYKYKGGGIVMQRKIFGFWIIFSLIFSAMASMVLGYDVRTNGKDITTENYTFDFYNLSEITDFERYNFDNENLLCNIGTFLKSNYYEKSCKLFNLNIFLYIF